MKSAETQQIWKFYEGLWKLNLKFYFYVVSWKIFWEVGGVFGGKNVKVGISSCDMVFVTQYGIFLCTSENEEVKMKRSKTPDDTIHREIERAS